jgi:Zn-dependent protease/CBS domain-containing protein
MDGHETHHPNQRGRQRHGAFSLGRIFGIPIFVDFSWLLIFFLIALTVSEVFKQHHPQWLPAQHWFAGIVTSLLFFACVLLHELGHSVVARLFGIPVISITLFLFGGISQIRSDAAKPSHEFLIAIAGPLTSVVLAGIFFLLLLLSGPQSANPASLSMFGSICLWLMQMNILLAVFNMIPGFPLDGGRVLRSLLWAASGRFDQATQIAAGIGSFIAYLFIAGGIFLAFSRGDFMNGLWIAFIGWFLLMAARSSVMQLVTRRAFADHRVADVLEPIPYRVSPAMGVQALVDGPVLQHGHVSFIVEDNGILRGMVTLQEIKALPREEWQNTPLQSVMIPAGDLVVVEPNVSLQTVMETMDERGVNQMPVVDGDRVLGMVTRDGLLRVLRMQMEFGVR